MLQRVQSIFLFLSALCMIAILFLPLWGKVDVEKNEKMTLSALVLKLEKTDVETGEITMISEKQTFYLAILAVLSAAIGFYSIFRYDNRLLQMKLGALNSLVMGAALGISVYLTMQSEEVFMPGVRGEFEEGYYAFVGALILNLLSNRFIKRDEKLVRSADRIR